MLQHIAAKAVADAPHSCAWSLPSNSARHPPEPNCERGSRRKWMASSFRFAHRRAQVCLPRRWDTVAELTSSWAKVMPLCGLIALDDAQKRKEKGMRC